MPIKKLSDTLIAQIAAGEVIERPSSIIKELIDNALDAGAKTIKVWIDEGGLSKIVVQDDGVGMGAEDLALAFEAHATSKIQTQEDLLAVISMGFRGEALASIGGISDASITSHPKGQAHAYMVRAKGAQILPISPCAVEFDGTRVVVENIFFHIPARRKFLKSAAFEFQKCKEIFLRFALCYPDIAFYLFKDQKQQYAFQPSTHKERMEKVVGDPQQELMVPVLSEFKDQNITITGWVCALSGMPSHKEIQFFFINGRYVKDKGLSHAIKTAGASLKLPKDNGFVLFIQMPTHQVDVNAHPAKVEVRFKDARLMYQAVYESVKAAFEKKTAQLVLQNAQVPVPIGQDEDQGLSKDAYAGSKTDENLFDHTPSKIASLAFIKNTHTSTGLPAGWEVLGGPESFWLVRTELLRALTWAAYHTSTEASEWLVASPLVSPVSIPITLTQWGQVQSFNSYLSGYGIEGDVVGTHTWCIKALPLWLTLGSIVHAMHQVLASLSANHTHEQLIVQTLLKTPSLLDAIVKVDKSTWEQTALTDVQLAAWQGPLARRFDREPKL